MSGLDTFNRGSVVLVSLCFTAVLGIAVAGYVALCSKTMSLSNRSLAVTSSLQLAEIGVEEAMWSFNNDDWTGWTISGNNATKQLTGLMSAQGASGSASITVENYSSTAPTITVNGISPMTGGAAVIRQIKATTKPAVLFNNAIAAIDPTNSGYVDFGNVNGSSVDSYQSSVNVDPANGAQTRTDEAIVSGPSVYAYYARITGYLSTTSTSSYIFLDTPYIGTLKGAATAANVNVDTSRVSTSPSQPLFDILDTNSFPGTYMGTLTVTSQTTGGGQGQGQGQGKGKGKGGGGGGGGGGSGGTPIGTAGASTAEIYYITDLALIDGMTLTVDGPVIIYVSNNFSIAGTGSIDITANGSLQIVVDNDIDIAGGGITNQTMLPKNLGVFGRKVSISTPYQTLSTTTPFYGVVYSPGAVLEIGGNATVLGALVARYVNFTAATAIHYDLDLRNATFSVMNTPLEITRWQELGATGS